ncbi:polysaccharide pyruvyl transferase family protein [Ruficoccus sp. ZRK36]|uniref:polysaccharide pyruvyl transferase family protein n=1 Tax=Ruficoccus sp. ZRK36 TaxID=2866311 RepID=UPI001C72FB8F|nr:polysaccharide pyruvyl transferase family protein [Ruficoccus sp. ZRK36]QYY35516.1 polysaccharide pyruvyl transferase family protein [Ruficoccus sp. ZRK36]
MSSSPKPTIIVRSSWQTVNIGDIGHTPGLLHLLQQYLPEAHLVLWGCKLDNGVLEMLQIQFPNVEILTEDISYEPIPSSEYGRQVWENADLFVHGSGPGLIMKSSIEAWAATGKPYGIYGVTLEKFPPENIELLSGARFVFCRDTVSLTQARAHKVKSPCLEFAPDAAFAADEQDETRATAFLAEHGLEEGEFICALSRLRYTPYFLIHKREPNETEIEKSKISQAHKVTDHMPIRTAIIRWVRETGKKVLLCPEMTYEIELTKEQLFDTMPEDVKPFLVWRSTYWCPDEATSVYARSIAVLSMEMHSPLLAFAVNIPAIYLRLPTDTCKGQMWRDVGLPEWIFEVEDSDGDDVAETLLNIYNQPERTRQKLAQSRQHVEYLQRHSMSVVSECLQEAVAQRLSPAAQA